MKSVLVWRNVNVRRCRNQNKRILDTFQTVANPLFVSDDIVVVNKGPEENHPPEVQVMRRKSVTVSTIHRSRRWTFQTAHIYLQNPMEWALAPDQQRGQTIFDVSLQSGRY